MSKLQNFSIEEFTDIVSSSFYFGDLLEKLGYSKNNGSSRLFIKRRCEKEGISLSHMIGRKGRKVPRKSIIPLEEILVKDSKYLAVHTMKSRILKANLLENKCSECGLLPFWNNSSLTLQLDHINGINNDNRIENLRILCPNCHTQTKTFGSKNRK
jgi:hypothetical protein